MIARQLGYFCRASSVSSSMYFTTPFKIACLSRSSTGSLRHASSAAAAAPPCPLIVSAYSTSRSVASGRRLRITSSTSSLSRGSISSYTASWPAFTMPMSSPA